MKFILNLSALMVLFGFTSCVEIDDVIDKEIQSGNQLEYRSGSLNIDTTLVLQIINSIPYSDINVNHGLLHFNSMNSLTLTYDLLDSAQIIWEHTLDTALTNYSGDPDEVGYSDFFPIEKFLEYFPGFNSLYEHILDLQLVWLQSEYLDFENDPENITCQSIILRALYNKYSEFVVNDSIYKEFDFGLGVSVPNFNLNHLTNLRELNDLDSIELYVQQNNLILIGPWDELPYYTPDNYVCRWWDRNRCGFFKPDDNKKIARYTIGIYNNWFLALHYFYAENTSWKKYWFGWFRHRTEHTVALAGYIWGKGPNSHCELAQLVDIPEYCGKCSYVRARYNYWPHEGTIRVSNQYSLYLLSGHETWDMLKRTCLPRKKCNPDDCN